MTTSETLKRKIKTSQDLQSVVKTMKTLAAVSIRQYEKAVESLTDYNLTVEMGLQILLRQKRNVIPYKRKSQNLGIIIFGSDQGMCGQFNDNLANYICRKQSQLTTETPHISSLAVGLRVFNALAEAGLNIEEYFPVPSSANAITPLVQALLLKIDSWQSQYQIHRIILVYNQLISAGSYQPTRLQILPIDREWLENLQSRPWKTKVLPTFTMKPEQLFRALIEQYFFVSLYRACANSLASENASRLASMQVAEKNIGELLEKLNREYQQERQTSITSELLDIVSGFEALISN